MSPLEIIDYDRYLLCEECKKTGLYCSKHRAEVEQLLVKFRHKMMSD